MSNVIWKELFKSISKWNESEIQNNRPTTIIYFNRVSISEYIKHLEDMEILM